MGATVQGKQANVLGLDSLSILFNHRSFQKSDPFFPGIPEVFWKDSDPWKEWNWKVPLDNVDARPRFFFVV